MPYETVFLFLKKSLIACLKSISVLIKGRNLVVDRLLEHLGCISWAKSKKGLLLEITRILFSQRNKESEKGLIADSFLR